MPFLRIYHQKGVALIVVMLIVALITILVVEMSSRLQLNIARTANVKANNQAFWYALGAEQFAKSSLNTLRTLSDGNINLSQPWAQEFEYPVEGGSIKAKLSDLQACFNLNAINSTFSAANNNQASPPSSNDESNASQPSQINTENNSNNVSDPNGPTPSQQAFQRLLENFINDSYTIDTIRDALVDWIDEDNIPSSFGAEDVDYESFAIPYLAANTPMSHPSEIRLLNGIDQVAKQGVLKDITKVICVLPETNLRINVNTITQDNAVVLSALLGDTLQTGLDIVNSRPEEGYSDINDFLALSEVAVLNLTPEQTSWFSVASNYFKLDTVAKFQGSQFKMSTVFKFENDGIVVVSREFGGAF